MQSETNFSKEPQWDALYKSLTKFVKGYIASQNVSCWQGQIDDLVDDIVQHSIVRLYMYLEQVKRGEAKPLLSLEWFGKTIARNYCSDLRRKDKRMIRPQQDEESGESELWLYDDNDQPEEIVEVVSDTIAFNVAVSVIADLAAKQQTSVITDLAKYAHFEDGQDQTPLEQAFDEVGINFRAYRHLLPVDPLLKGRHAASLSIGYKKVREQTLAILREIGLVS